MGIFDFLKTKWSAGGMTEEDRKKMFWYLKRTTSYTAWKRQADAFDRFAEIFEKQVQEQPVAKAGESNIWDTNWETSYPEVLKCQVLYEKALARLKQGDRSVWLYNELGIMGDAAVIASSWHANMVNHGAGGQGDKYFDGKYVPDMEAALKEWFTCAVTAGYLQPQFEDAGAPDTFYSEKFDAYPHLSRHAVIFPSRLSDVPVPDEEILVRTGEQVPVFGIYEPQIKDGCMNYLLGGTTAYSYDMAQKRSVTWKLIWEDTRYLDGHISNEEESYFPAQAGAKAVDAHIASGLLSASSGQSCPKTGNWAVMDDLQGKAKLSKGDKMPQHLGRDVTWVWSD
jgi:Immunity protein 72/Immunity protein 71